MGSTQRMPGSALEPPAVKLAPAAHQTTAAEHISAKSGMISYRPASSPASWLRSCQHGLILLEKLWDHSCEGGLWAFASFAASRHGGGCWRGENGLDSVLEGGRQMGYSAEFGIYALFSPRFDGPRPAFQAEQREKDINKRFLGQGGKLASKSSDSSMFAKYFSVSGSTSQHLHHPSSLQPVLPGVRLQHYSRTALLFLDADSVLTWF